MEVVSGCRENHEAKASGRIEQNDQRGSLLVVGIGYAATRVLFLIPRHANPAFRRRRIHRNPSLSIQPNSTRTESSGRLDRCIQQGKARAQNTKVEDPK